MPPGQLEAVTPDDVGEIETVFEQLFNGPLPGSLEGGEGFFPLLPGRENLVEKAIEVVDTYNSNNWRYGLAVFMVKSAIEKIVDVLPRLVKTVDYALDHYVPVVSLYRTASNWTDKAMTPLSEIAGAINREIDRERLDWDDHGRDIYRGDIVPHQHDAAAAARDHAAYISNLLSEIGTANVDYATDIIEHVAKVYSQLLVIVAELASVIGSPFAIQDAAGLIETIINEFVGVATTAVDAFAASVERIQNAENELADHTYFPDGNWPEAVDRA